MTRDRQMPVCGLTKGNLLLPPSLCVFPPVHTALLGSAAFCRFRWTLLGSKQSALLPSVVVIATWDDVCSRVSLSAVQKPRSRFRSRLWSLRFHCRRQRRCFKGKDSTLLMLDHSGMVFVSFFRLGTVVQNSAVQSTEQPCDLTCLAL